MASLDTERSNAVEQMRAALAEGEIMRAADWFRRANELDPGDEHLAVEYAEALGERERFEAMSRVAENALERHPDSARLHRVHGWAEFNLEHWQPAADAFATALRLEPGDEVATRARITALRALGDLDGAQATLDAALPLHPNSSNLHKAAARIQADRGRWEAALDEFGKVDAADEDRALGQTDALVALHRYADARAVIEAAVQAHPQSAALRSRLAWLELIRGRCGPAVDSFVRATELGSEDVWTTVGHARALCGVARYSDAWELLYAAVTLAPDEHALHIEAGATAMATHDYATARAAYGRALELDPKSEKAQKGFRRARWLTGYWRLLARPTRALDRATRQNFAQTTPALAAIDELTRLDAPTRTLVKARVADFSWRWARVKATTAILTNVLGALWALALIVMAIVVPLVLGRQGGAGGIDGFDLVLAYIAALWLPLIGSGLVLTKLPSGTPVAIGAMAACVLYAGGAVAAASAAESIGPSVATPLVWSLTVNAIGLLLIIVTAVALFAGERVAARAVDSRAPHAACLWALADLLARLRDGVALADRAQVVVATGLIERAASMLRAHLRSEPTGDLRTNEWLGTRADGHAEALRECKKGLLSPGVGSVETLRRRLADDFVHIARGHWRHLPWTDPGPGAAKTRRLRVRTTIRTGLIALVPLAIVLLISWQGWFSLGGDAADELKLIALGWAFLSILMPLDPGFSDKFAALRGGAELLKPGGK
jgi:tetratricopeptide (TPR) repeat protein